MAGWMHSIHPPRESVAATVTEDEQAASGRHFARLQQLLADDALIPAGPTPGPIDTGVAVFEAASEEAARRLMDADPAIAERFARGGAPPPPGALLRGGGSARAG